MASEQPPAVDYVLVAEFDLLEGSVIRCQYPQPIPGLDETHLAAWMLPEGAHLREDDWTVFILNRPMPQTAKAAAKKENRKSKPSCASASASVDEPASPKRNPSTIAMSSGPIPANIYRYENEWLPIPDEQTICTLSFALVSTPSASTRVNYEDPPSLNMASTFAEEGRTSVSSLSTEATGLPTWELVIKDSASDVTLLTTSVHEDLQFTCLQENFCSLYTLDGIPIGINFLSTNDQEEFQKQLTERLENDPALYQYRMSLRSSLSNASEVSTNPSTANDTADTSTEVTVDASSSVAKTPPMMYCLSLLRNKLDKTVRRGAMVKSMAICTRHQAFHLFKPLLILALDRYFQQFSSTTASTVKKDPSAVTDATADRFAVVKQLYETLNRMSFANFPLLTSVEKRIAKRTTPGLLPREGNEKAEFVTNVSWDRAQVPIRIPLALDPDELVEGSLVMLVSKFKEAAMILYNAILEEKRVLFIGHTLPAGQVCQMVLSSPLLVSPPLRGLTLRIFPYADLNNLDFLSVPGYIAGVTNPMFEQRTAWWDICCDLSSGRVMQNVRSVRDNRGSSAVTPANAAASWEMERHFNSDQEFIHEIESGINSHFGEEWVRSRFMDYTQHIVNMALGQEEFADETTLQKEYDSNWTRIDRLRTTKSFAMLMEDRERIQTESALLSVFPVDRHLRRLKIQRDLSESDILRIYSDFVNHIETPEHLLEFLSYLPENQGGLYPVAVGLFHPNVTVRRHTVTLIKRLETLPVGMKVISRLNYYLLLTYHREMKGSTDINGLADRLGRATIVE
eukprot:GILJ01004226.1.p1 GENE.GILJ01004226.1~~GILJ01004226.1.p1  ORF type:complete len:811 (+),score=125.65 GILJ01004226.1:46-2433(+)